MLSQPISRRRFIASTSVVAAAAAIPAAKSFWSDGQAASMLVSSERLDEASLQARAVVLEGPRIERLNGMAARLPSAPQEIVLRLDATDDQLLDIAAQQAGVNVKRGAMLPDGSGIRARVIPQTRNAA